MGAERRAAIDIGTNTILLLIADVETGRNPRVTEVIHDEQTIVRLGQGVAKNRAFAPEAMERARLCLKRCAETCTSNGVLPKDVVVVATSASRDAANSAAFYEQVARETGLKARIIEGVEEARMSFAGGILDGQDPLKVAILDIGGGSTEFVTAKKSSGGFAVKGESIDMGSVRAKDLFLPTMPYNKSDLERMELELRGAWSGLSSDLQTELRAKEWVGVAGTVTTLAAVALNLRVFDASRMHGFKMDRCMVGDLYESLATLSNAQRAANPAIGEGRADVIVPGAAILLTAMEAFGRDEITVSVRGLRFGAVLT
jgi:exopolyphosphatase/guanosine-5'-triphosphate,3'-diphosphate pyrophosphatase